MNEFDYLFSDAGTAPAAGPMFTPPEAGIGLSAEMPAFPEAPTTPAPTLPAETDPVKALIAKMGPGEKFLSAIGEMGSAMIGRGSPLKRRAGLQQDERRTKLSEFKINADALEDSVKWSQKLTDPGERKKFVDIRTQQLNEQSPGLGDQFRVFSEKPDLISRYGEYQEFLPDHLKLMARADPDGFMKYMSSQDGVKALEAAKDKSTLRMATKKAQTAVMAWDQLAPPDVVARFKKDGIITASEFMEAQQYVPQAARLSEQEIEVAMRTPGFWQALNIAGPGEESEARKKRLAEGPQSTVGKIKADLKAGRITQAEADAAIEKANRDGGITINMPGSSGMGVNPETGKPGHYTIGKDGTVRWDPVGPLPKSGNPIQEAVAEIIRNPGAAPAPKSKHKVGDTVQRAGKTWKITGFDKDGEPLVEEVKVVKKR